ncbi:MAG: hypothetical protein H0T45_12340 [Pyrinomonadaceae bacterium]|nr:hypothetical protein [Pyrinomonadaceae bacterium]MDQ3134873.1 hypothetical protein [Acidobacteriota bacterium]
MNEKATDRRRDDLVERDRADETGDIAAPDAPTSIEENDGMSTILSDGEPVDGVQENASE